MQISGLTLMSNAVALVNELQSNLPALPEDQFQQLVGPQNSFSSRLQLFSFNSGPVQEEKIKAGRFGIANGNELTDLGESVTFIPVAIRPKAMDLTQAKPIIAYDVNGDLFNQICTRSKVKDSDCMCGVEFLVYVPDKDTFTTFYMANKTLLREATNVKANLGNPITLKAKLIEKNKMRWHGVVTTACAFEVAIPPKERFKSEIDIFGSAQDIDLNTIETSE